MESQTNDTKKDYETIVKETNSILLIKNIFRFG
jgi:hypothetical protein